MNAHSERNYDMNEQQRAFIRVLSLIERAGCQQHVILIGSWVEFVYHEAGILTGFTPNIRTLDVDFLVKNLRRPNPPISLAVLAQEEGFLVESDYFNRTTKLSDVSGLEVEFLISKVGAGVEVSLMTNIGVTAQTLRHMEILFSNTIETVCLGYSVLVPTPEAYAVHKMIINTQRKDKAKKDINAVLGIWPYLDKIKVNRLLSKLTKKEYKNVMKFMDANEISQ